MKSFKFEILLLAGSHNCIARTRSGSTVAIVCSMHAQLPIRGKLIRYIHGDISKININLLIHTCIDIKNDISDCHQQLLL